MFCATFNFQTRSRACLKIHSRHLHAPLSGIFAPNSGYVARYAPFIRDKSPTKCDVQLSESNFKIRSRACLIHLLWNMFLQFFCTFGTINR
ncbi:DUF6783 domain-containing protein [uncultured Robinsoniella sp.]|uniref:DUF6783 domain-containing protein n=1 Tax=uncultured Robinsoniella sp. TaxID=904190 RepID=UPI00374F0669